VRVTRGKRNDFDGAFGLGKEEAAMNIYVGNLPYSTTDADLRDAFEPFGEVESARVIMDRVTDRSKGFGFVEMPDAQEGQAAIEKLDGSQLEGRTIKVNEARPREARPHGSRDFPARA
jgi:RNA recognition motif-containing protein